VRFAEPITCRFGEFSIAAAKAHLAAAGIPVRTTPAS